DWKMTFKEFWRHAAECAPERVQAGLKAKLSVFLRSTDGMRSSILHHACREACTDEVGSDTARRRLEVVKLLLDAKANADAVDFKDRTALDLAIAQGGAGAKAHPSIAALSALGILTARQAAARALGLGLSAPKLSQRTARGAPAEEAARRSRETELLSSEAEVEAEAEAPAAEAILQEAEAEAEAEADPEEPTAASEAITGTDAELAAEGPPTLLEPVATESVAAVAAGGPEPLQLRTGGEPSDPSL
ncbi:unnamed protein product, partial [Polarella glacialis]